MFATALLLFSLLGITQAKVECNSTLPGVDDVCTGDYCFNIDDQIRGCVDFDRMIRDDNIACGYMNILGKDRKVCICTQPYCSKYSVVNMPTQTLADVDCTMDLGARMTCTPGPCYVRNDLLSAYGEETPERGCWQNWFALMEFKGPIIYEVPPLLGHPSCFFDGDLFNCMCKDPKKECNQGKRPVVPSAENATYFTCHKTQCKAGGNESCTDSPSLGSDHCVGQMCYYLSTNYNINIDGKVYQESMIARDCLNYSYENPIQDLTFVTGVHFGSNSGISFYPCSGDYCNSMQTGNAGVSTQAITLFAPMILVISVILCQKLN